MRGATARTPIGRTDRDRVGASPTLPTYFQSSANIFIKPSILH